jgi:hypothetical protein
MQPIQSTQPGVAVSPLQGLAQMATAYVGKEKQQRNDLMRASIAKQYGDWLDKGVGDYLSAGQPQEAAGPSLPGQPPPTQLAMDPMERIRMGLASRNPLVGRMASLDYARQAELDKPRVVNPGDTLHFPGNERPDFTTGPKKAIPDNWRSLLPAGATVEQNDPPGVFRMKGSDGVPDPYTMEFEGGKLVGVKRLDNANDAANSRAPYHTFILGPDGKIIVGDARTGKLSEGVLPSGERAVGGKLDPGTTGRNSNAQAAGHAVGAAGGLAQSRMSQIEQETQRGLALVDQLVGKEQGTPEEMKPHPGFSSYVGATLRPGFRFIHGTPEADFDRTLKQTLGQAFLQAYDSLRGTGQITQPEGQEAKAALTAMSGAQSEKEFVKSARAFQQVIRNNLINARNRAAQVQPNAGTAPAPGSTLKFDANGNPLP